MATMKRENFASLLTPIHRKVFFDNYNGREKQYTKIFKVDTMHAKEESFPHIGGFGRWEENTEGNDFNLATMTEGDTATFTARRFDKAYEVTWELVQDDLYNVMRGAGRGGSATKLGRGLQATEEAEAADVILTGFINSGYNENPLFTERQPIKGGQEFCQNRVEGTLTDEKVKEGLTLMRMQRDEAGILVGAHADRLIVHPDWEFTARAIVGSTLQAGTANNDKNTLPNLDVIVWDHLANASSRGEYLKPWILQDSHMDNLLFLWREKPIFDSEKMENKMDYRFYGYCRFAVGYADWRGLVGSTGFSDIPG